MSAGCRLSASQQGFVSECWAYHASIVIFTALGGLLADLTSTRTALVVAGLVVLTSPLLLPSGLGASLGTKSPPVTGLIARGYNGPRAVTKL